MWFDLINLSYIYDSITKVSRKLANVSKKTAAHAMLAVDRDMRMRQTSHVLNNTANFFSYKKDETLNYKDVNL